jgi:ABC-type antimicrobial peptide transport system permease subunit
LRKIVQPVVVGTVVGLTAVWWVSTAFQSKVAEISTGGTHAYSVAAALMIGTAVAAGWLPARRAARVDPAIVLREP